MNEMPDWINIPKDINDHYGFVYLITNKINNRKYIGKKFFWFKKTRPPLKGKKKKRHSLVESDWKVYWGSSYKLLEDIEELGYENFTREILYLEANKRDLAYREAELQFSTGALLTQEYYNGIINLRISYPVKASKDLK